MPKPVPFAIQLSIRLSEIERDYLEFIGQSKIKYVNPNAGHSRVTVFAPSHYWEEDAPEGKKLQVALLRAYSQWYEKFDYLIQGASETSKGKAVKANALLRKFIQKEQGWSTPDSIEKAKELVLWHVNELRNAIEVFIDDRNELVTLVLDTNALIKCPDFQRYGTVVGCTEYTVLIVPTVTKELDELKIKSRDAAFREKVNSVINRIKGLRKQGSLLDGVVVHKTVTVKMLATEPNFENTLPWLDSNNDDDRFISSTLEVQRAYPSVPVVIVTSDINLQNKAEMAGIPYSEPPDAEELPS